jgi:protein involved in polysaccharide export with SLBB domain
MIGRFVSLGIVLIASLLLAGCYRDFGPVVAEPEPPPPSLVVTHLQTGDRLTVTVYNEPLLTGVYDITPTGTGVMPLIGSVSAVGRTPTELARIIAARYSGGKFLQEPQVTVTVVEYRPVYIFGEVDKPGSYPFRPGFNALTAITEAGGLTYRGSRDTVYIQHAGETVWNEYPLLSSIAILPGDIIRVPERYF